MQSRSAPEVIKGWSRGVSGSLIREDRVTHVEHVWNTVISIAASGTRDREDDLLDVIGRCSELFARIDETFSTFKPHSEVSLYRNGLDRPGQQSAHFGEVMAACVDLRRATWGAFDPWAAVGGYDPSGYVKGWAAGCAREILLGGGFGDVLINAGGDVCATGDEVPGSGEGWPVGIVHPSRPSEVIEVVHLRNQSMATSARYERGDHVVDPFTGRPATRVQSATAVGPEPGAADAIATAALVDGRDSLTWLMSLGPLWSLHLVVEGTAFTYGPAFGD